MEAPTYVQGNDLLELLQVHEDRTVSCLTAQFQQQFQRFSQSLLAAFTPDPPEPLKSRLSTDVKQLQYKLKKHALRYALKGLKPDMNPTRLSIPHHHRMSTVHEILVCLSLAHDDWAAAHIQNYIPSDSTQQTDNTNQSIYKDINVPVQTRLQVTARKLELHLIKLVEKDRSGQATGNLYVQKVKAFRMRLVDDPVGQLKSAIDFGPAASRNQPNEIEQTQASVSRNSLEEPLVKRSCFRGIKDVSPELARPLSWLGMVDGKLGELNEF